MIFVVMGIIMILLVAVIGFMLINKTSGAAKPVPEKEILHDMGDFTTNLSDSSPLKYIKAKVVLKLDSSALEKEITDRQPILQDTIIGFLNNESSTDIMTDRSKLKANAMATLNSHLVTGKVIDIYFSDLVMQ